MSYKLFLEIKKDLKKLLPRLDLLSFQAFQAGLEYRLLDAKLLNKPAFKTSENFLDLIKKQYEVTSETLGTATIVALFNRNDETALNDYLALLEENIIANANSGGQDYYIKSLNSYTHVNRFNILDKIRNKPILYLGAKQITTLTAFFAGDRFALGKINSNAIEYPSWEDVAAEWNNQYSFAKTVDLRSGLLWSCAYDEALAFDRFFDLLTSVRRKNHAP